MNLQAAQSVAGAIGNRLLDALPAASLQRLQPDLKIVSLREGTVCYSPGDQITQVFFPHSGTISLLIMTGNGGAVEAAMIGREGAVGLQSALGSRLSFTRAAVQISGRFSVIPAHRIEQAAAHDSAIRLLAIQYVEAQWAEAQQIVACNAVHDASSRLCRWLLQSADRTGSTQLSLTHELLAEMLGVRRTTVTLLAQELQKRGAVRYSRGRIDIVDRAILERGACECYRVLKPDLLLQKIGVKF